MIQPKTLNIIVAGTGGQGVNTLSNLIRKLAVNKKCKCEGATFKGGAQRMGSVHSELRILCESKIDSIFSSQIPLGEVDVLIGLEPWEALRFAKNCNKKTKVLVNSTEEKLYVERFRETKLIDCVEELNSLFKDITVVDYTMMAKDISGNKQHVNLLMLQDAIRNNILPFTEKDLESIIDERND